MRTTPGRSIRASYFAVIPFACLYLFFFLIPLLSLIGYTTEDTLDIWTAPFANSSQITILVRTIFIALQVTALCVVVGYAYAFALAASGTLARWILLAALVAPLFANSLVLAYSWIVLLGPSGPVASALGTLLGPASTPQLIYNRVGTLLGLFQYLLPIFTLALFGSIVRTPVESIRAARSLGANGAQAFVSVQLPQSLPGAATGALLAFVTAVGFYVVPAMLGGTGDTMVSQLIQQHLEAIDFAGAAVLSYYLLACVLAILLIASRFIDLQGLILPRNATVQERSGGGRSRTSGALRLASTSTIAALDRVPWRRLSKAIAWIVATVSVLPVAALLAISLVGDPVLRFPPTGWSTRWWSSVIEDPSWIQAFSMSVQVGIVATVVALLVSVPLAWMVARSGWSPWARNTILLIAIIPFVLPVSALAVVMYVWFLDLRLIGNPVALGVAHALLGVPFAFAVCLVGFGGLDRSHERAARSLGAPPFATFRTVIVPMAMPTLAAAAFLAFFQSWTELVMALFVTTATAPTFPVRMWIGSQQEISPALAVVSVIAMTVTVTAAFLVLLVRSGLGNRRRKGGSFGVAP